MVYIEPVAFGRENSDPDFKYVKDFDGNDVSGYLAPGLDSAIDYLLHSISCLDIKFNKHFAGLTFRHPRPNGGAA